MRKSRLKFANERFFEKIDSEEKAYFFGILYCIGSIHTKNDLVTFDLKDENYEILEKLSIRIFGENKAKIKIIKNFKMATFRIFSSKLKNDLIQNGRLTDKENSIFPNLSDELELHFVRGLFDATGCCDFNFDTNRYNISFECFENKTKFLEKFFHKYDIKYCITKRVIKIFTRITCLKFLELMYKNQSICFSRKLQKLNELRFERLNKDEVTRILKNIDLVHYYNEGLSFSEISKRLDVDCSTMFRFCRNLGLNIKSRVNKFLRIYYDERKRLSLLRDKIVCTGPCKKFLPRTAFYKKCVRCKKCWSENAKKYYLNNIGKLTVQQLEKRRKNQRKYGRKRLSTPEGKLRAVISGYIRDSLKNNGGDKRGKSCMNFLPYTIQELKEHIEKQFEPWMNWNNWGIYRRESWNDDDPSTWRWQLDHIVPNSTFLYSSMESDGFQKSWSLNNLRPYSAKQNVIDGITKIRHSIK